MVASCNINRHHRTSYGVLLFVEEKYDGNYFKRSIRKWEICESRICTLCAEGRIAGAIKVGPVWMIPIGAEQPDDKRIKLGKYIKENRN